jgi:hypothetical protein
MMKDSFLFKPVSWPGVNLINTASSAALSFPTVSEGALIENPGLLQNLY